MKKYLPVLGLICLFYSQLFSQSSDLLDRLNPYAVRSIDSDDTNFDDFQFLKEVLKDKRIVLLGEQTHGDGATFEAKVRLIKFLHQELGFSMLSFESSMYANYKLYPTITEENAKNTPLKESIIQLWSDTKELEPLFDYIHARSSSKNPLLISGFDSQQTPYFTSNFLNEIRKWVDLNANDIGILEQVLEAGAEFIASDENDSTLFFSACKKIKESLDYSLAKEKSTELQMLKQTFSGWLAMIQWEIEELNEKEIKVQNPRDDQMARNLIFLANLYPDKKIIAWGATYHFMNRIEEVEITDLTNKYAHRLDSAEKNHEKTDLHENLDGAVPMGRFLKDHFGNSIYSLGFSSFEGTYGIVGREVFTMLQPPSESIEELLVKRGLENAFVDYSMGPATKFYSSAMGNLPFRAPWQHVLDGLFFIKKSYPPSFASTTSVKQTHTLPASRSEFIRSKSKQVVDSQTGQPVSFAAVSLEGTSKGVATNVGGEFSFNIPEAKSTDHVLISSMGYETTTLTVADLNKKSKIELKQKPIELNAVEVHAKSQSAKEIIRKAEKAIDKNYYQLANSQEVFLRVANYTEDSLTFNEEASVQVYDTDGYQPSSNAIRSLKGEILQFRNTTQNPQKDIWSGVGGLWLMYTHDVVLDKSNVLHRVGFYSVTLVGITTFENRRVFEISFDCKRPGAFTTGFGYSAPKSATGKIFIDVESYAVLKIETMIVRKPHSSKRHPEIFTDPYGYHLIQTYKEFEGKYFLNYSRQLMYARETDSKRNQTFRYSTVRELMSTEIKTKSYPILTLPLTKIKTVPTPTHPEFWQDHNVIIEDDVEKLYELVGLSKK